MTKASDNIFARLILDAVTSDPAAPSNDNWELFARVNGIYARNSNTTVGPIVFGTSLSNPMTTTGDIIYSSDNSGTATRRAIGSNGQVLHTNSSSLPAWLLPPGFEFDYTEVLASVSVTATTEGTANTVVTGQSVTYDGSTTVLVEFRSTAVDTPAASAGSLIILLYDGASLLGRFGTFTNTTQAALQRQPVYLARRLTPSAAAHQFIVKALVSSGTGSVGSGNGGSNTNLPMFLRVTKA